jgi:hypothetical protein
MNSERPPPPWTPEEMDAKLAELRADPEKAAAFRADLHKRMKQAFDKLPKWPVPLHQLIAEAFSFLVSEYGFTEHEKTRDGFLGSVTVKEYSKARLQSTSGQEALIPAVSVSLILRTKKQEYITVSGSCCQNRTRSSSIRTTQHLWT